MDEWRREKWVPYTGADRLENGDLSFRVWAPRLKKVTLKLFTNPPKVYPMEKGEEDIFSIIVPNVPLDVDYVYILDEGHERPDPASRFQPYGVHGPSRLIDPKQFVWSDQAWKGVDLKDLLIYEIHIGTFTPEGTFDAVIDKLPYLLELGVNAIELMPIAEFAGERNWGYDGVCLYAPSSAYGGPLALKRLVDACHRSGLAVVLDVVYNHLGPEGNYLIEYAPFFTHRHTTPWGDAINFDDADSDGVRRYFIDNALYWLTEYHIDALRMDAVDQIFDMGFQHLFHEISAAFKKQAEDLGRKAWLIAETSANDARLMNPVQEGGFGIDAQWNDEFHHALHMVLVKKGYGYLADYGKMADLRKAIVEGYVYDGKRRSNYRKKRFGSSSLHHSGERFAIAIQNHDQVANTYHGKRIASLLTFEQQKLAATIFLCAPNLPILFMGQEFAEEAPFYYFTSHSEPALIEAVREGRKKELSYHQEEFYDPQEREIFEKSKIRWSTIQNSPHKEMLLFYRDLIALRKNNPCLNNCRKDLVQVNVSEQPAWMIFERSDPAGLRVLIIANFSDQTLTLPILFPEGKWSLALWSGDAKYGGLPGREPPVKEVQADGKATIDLSLYPWCSAIFLNA